MFRQIHVHPPDWDLQRILWTDNNRVVAYQLITITYSTRSAPYFAGRALEQLLIHKGANYSLAVEHFERQFRQRHRWWS